MLEVRKASRIACTLYHINAYSDSVLNIYVQHSELTDALSSYCAIDRTTYVGVMGEIIANLHLAPSNVLPVLAFHMNATIYGESDVQFATRPFFCDWSLKK